MIQSPPLPAELCRFRSFGSPSAGGKDDRAVYDLLRGRLRFSDITTFNDPFEARPRYVPAFRHAGEQRKAMIKYLTSMLRDGSKTKRRQTAETMVGGKSMAELLAIAEKRSHPRAGELFVLCLMAPATISTPLPWAHYGDCHRGVCINLDTSKRPLSVAFPVEYSHEYPELVIPRTHREPIDTFRNVLLRKSADWAYEKEYRVIRYVKKEAPPLSRTLMVRWEGQTALSSPDIVKSITLGCRMAGETRDRLIRWVRANTPNVEIWQATLHPHRYEVVRHKVV